MVPVTLTKPSAPTYVAGVYYDGLIPLTAANCADAKYLQLDVSSSVTVGTAQINIVKKVTKAPTIPSVVLNTELNNWTWVRGMCNGGWCSAESTAVSGLNMLKAHRISVYKSEVSSSLASWQQMVQPYQMDAVFTEFGDAPAWIANLPANSRYWAYVIDEPKYWDFTTLSQRLANWAKYPGVKPMMTSPLRQRDYNPANTATFGKIVDWPADVKAGIKIHVPVAEEFCQETWKGSGDWYACKADYDAAGKELWLYVSNMSHGNEGGNADGAPDLVIDRPASESFGFYLLALKYGIKNLLYYNSIEGWELIQTQDIWTNPYQFGGNGDGLLLYPDRTNKVAFASIRLKLLREASQFADIINAAGMSAQAGALVTDTLHWNHDLAAIAAVRDQALAKLQ